MTSPSWVDARIFAVSGAFRAAGIRRDVTVGEVVSPGWSPELLGFVHDPRGVFHDVSARGYTHPEHGRWVLATLGGVGPPFHAGLRIGLREGVRVCSSAMTETAVPSIDAFLRGWPGVVVLAPLESTVLSHLIERDRVHESVWRAVTRHVTQDVARDFADVYAALGPDAARGVARAYLHAAPVPFSRSVTRRHTRAWEAWVANTRTSPGALARARDL